MKHCLIVIILCWMTRAQAQRFAGGAGNGYLSFSTEAFVAGGNPNAKYAGATGNGFSSIARETFIGGGNPNARYGGGSGTGYTLQGSDGLFLNGLNPNARYAGGTGDGYQIAVMETFIPGGNPYARYAGGAGNGFHSNEGQLVLALPVVLMQFDAVLHDHQVELSWATAQEMNNRMFEVERSSNQVETNTIESVAGIGQRSVINYYRVLDAHPLAGVSYYRLKQTDIDGTIDYSKWVAVHHVDVAEEQVLVWPNPNTGSFTVTVPGAFETATLYDLNGNSVAHYTDNGIRQLSFNTIRTGLYMLAVTGIDGRLHTTKVCVY